MLKTICSRAKEMQKEKYVNVLQIVKFIQLSALSIAYLCEFDVKNILKMLSLNSNNYQENRRTKMNIATKKIS